MMENIKVLKTTTDYTTAAHQYATIHKYSVV